MVEVKTRAWGLIADEDSSYLSIDGLQFRATAFKFGRDPGHRSSHIALLNSTVEYGSWTEYVGVTAGPQSDPAYPTMEVDNSVVENNTFAYGSLSGLYINGFDNIVSNNDFHDFCYSSSLTYPPLQVSRATQAMVGKAGRTIVRQNTFARSGGIQVQVAQRENQVYLNEFRDSFLAAYGGNKDTSVLYTQNVFCTRTRLHHNWVHGGYSGTPPLEWGGGMGIRGDDKTAGLTIDHNVVWDLGAPGIMVKSVDNPTPEQANVCVNNTVFNHSAYIPVKGAILMQSTANNQNRYSTVVNNLADSIRGWWFAAPLGQIGQSSNNSGAFNPATDLVNASWHDFRPVGPSSIDAGTTVAGITGTVFGRAPDIGAYEWGDAVYWIPGRRTEKASFPIVPDHAAAVPAGRDVLMWKPAYRAVGHTVYFSNSPETLGRSGKTLHGEDNVFALPVLSKGTVYFWRVDAIMPDQSIVSGDVWSFTTK